MADKPITREEVFLAKAGGQDVKIPDPITRQEVYLAKIAGEDVVIPKPITREEFYLAKIAGEDVKISTPVTRVEKFLANIAGEEVVIPKPITRKERFLVDWAEDVAVKYDTATGEIVTFDNGVAKPLKKLEVALEPIQDLHGYGNPWPPGGGKNLLNPAWYGQISPVTVQGVKWTFNADGTITADGTALANSQVGFVLTGHFSGNYYFCGNPDAADSVANIYVWNSTAGARAKKWNGSTAVGDSSSEGNLQEVQLNANDSFTMTLRVMSGKKVENLTFYPMIILSSVTDPTFAPYSNICPISGHDSVSVWVQPTHDTSADPTAEIAFPTPPTTVYGGTVDLVSGVLTVTHGLYAFTGNETYVQVQANRVAIKVAFAMASSPVGWCTDFKYVGTGTTNFIYLTTSMPAADLKTYMANNSVKAVYALATPQTYQLTPTEIDALKGSNVIWSDAGPVTVEYPHRK